MGGGPEPRFTPLDIEQSFLVCHGSLYMYLAFHTEKDSDWYNYTCSVDKWLRWCGKKFEYEKLETLRNQLENKLEPIINSLYRYPQKPL